MRVAIVSASSVACRAYIKCRGGASEAGKTVFLLNGVGLVNVLVNVSAVRSTSAP